MDRLGFLRRSLKKSAEVAISTVETVQEVRRNISDRVGDLVRESLVAPDGRAQSPYRQEIQPPISRDTGERFIRPPGARPEADFQSHCTGCGDCISACPHSALFTYQNEGQSPLEQGRTILPHEGPVLDPNLNACRLCEDYPCVSACTHQALLPERVENSLPYFGTAQIDPASCTRTTYGDTCILCWEECPVHGAILPAAGSGQKPIPGQDPGGGPAAWGDAVSQSFPLEINPESCIGCGICVEACPTFPRSIVIYRKRDNTP